MKHLRKGSIVVRKSHRKDIIFKVEKIIKTHNNQIALLRGITERVEADSPIEDLEIVESEVVKKELNNLDRKIKNMIKSKKKCPYKIAILNKKRDIGETVITGKILHLDGDKNYSNKSYYYYKKVGLNAIVKNIPEYKQPKVVYSLLKMYKPDILIITRS